MYLYLTAGAVSIATMSEKTAGTKFEISTLRNDRDLWFFSLYTHLQREYLREKELGNL